MIIHHLLFMLLGLLIGTIIGFLIGKAIKRDKPIGTLRVDQSDPDGQYIFLELSPDGFNRLEQKKSVRLEVKLENYISRE